MIKDIRELEAEYKEFVVAKDGKELDLSKWLPEFRSLVRPVRPGELVVILAPTGHGKTAILQNIAVSCRELNFAFFELELPGTACFERFMAIYHGKTQAEVEAEYGKGYVMRTGPMDHIFTCDAARVKPSDIEMLVEKSGQDFDVLMIDYIGLLSGGAGKSRYERVSANAEELKRVARNLNCVVVVASQVHRKDDGCKTIGLSDAKDSGSIENSAQLVIGAVRCGERNEQMTISILKGTGGGSGESFVVDFHGPSLKIKSSLKGVDEIEEGLKDADLII